VSSFARMRQFTITIDGMHCGGCAASVKRVLDKTPGVTDARVEVGRAEVSGDETLVTEAALRDAIENAGFEAKTVTPT